MCKENKFKKISEGERLGVVINLNGEEECPLD